MRSLWKIALAAITSSLLLPAAATATTPDVEDQLRAMRDRLDALEDRLRATDDELDAARRKVEAQQEAMEEAGIGDEESGLSALSTFLEATDFIGWVNSSYTYNFQNTANDGLVGQNDGLPFHNDSNSFKMNQAWFSMDKTPTEESRAGFHVDLLFGSDADVLNGEEIDEDNVLGNDGVEVFTAYASYLAPIGPGLRVDMGEMQTLLGAEVVQAPYNFNITRGRVWGIQPITHTGIIGSMALENGMGVALGVVNDGFSDANFDTDSNKTVTGQISYAEEDWSAAVSMLWGSPLTDAMGSLVNDEGDKTGLLDVLITYAPAETLELWLNFDFGWKRDHWFRDDFGERINLDDSEVYAIAVAGRYEVFEGTGFALRFEFLRESDGYLMLERGNGDSELYTLTATIDHALTKNLIARLEGRFDWAEIDGGSNKLFRNARGNQTQSSQHVMLADVTYNF